MRDARAMIASARRQDAIFRVVGAACVVVVLLVLAVLIVNLCAAGLSRVDWQFLTSFPSRRAERAGILSSWVGSLLIMLVTAASAIPLGVAAGIYLEEYAKKNRFTQAIEINITNLAGVPSIVYGLMALGLFVYTLGLDRSILTGGLTLGFLVLPIIIVATRESLRAIPQHMREAAAALGASRWRVVKDHLLPYASGGIATGVIISMSRAIGETAPLVTIGALTYIAFLPPAPYSAEAKDWARAVVGLNDRSAAASASWIGHAARSADASAPERAWADDLASRGELGPVAIVALAREVTRGEAGADNPAAAAWAGHVLDEQELGLVAGATLPGVAWVKSPFTVLPIQMFAWVSRPGADLARNAAATGIVLLAITLVMNGAAIIVRYRIRRRITW